MKKLKKLSPKLPDEMFEITDVEDCVISEGFQGNRTDSTDYVTDGHVLILASAIPEERRGEINEDPKWEGKKPNHDQCAKMFAAKAARQTNRAYFIGVAQIEKLFVPDGELTLEDYYNVAVIRDGSARILCVNANLLAFALHFSDADTLAIDAGTAYVNEPLYLLRDGKLVSLIMPMRFGVRDVVNYDLDGDAVELR